MNAPRHVGRALPEMKYGTRTIADAAPAASALPVATVVGVASTASAESDTAAARRGRMASCGCSAPGHAAAGTRCAATRARCAQSKGTRIAARPSELGDGEKLGGLDLPRGQQSCLARSVVLVDRWWQIHFGAQELDDSNRTTPKTLYFSETSSQDAFSAA